VSGIAGIYYLDGRPVEKPTLECMVDSLRHRGPDGAGTWIAGPIGLGHRLLWTTPESTREQQPLLSQDGQLCLTADARIDNRAEVQAQVRAAGRYLRTDTDAELVLQAYEAWGEACCAKLIGDFAFAIWDERRRQLFAARDAIGIKPFYYHASGTVFRWGSEPKALFADGTLRREPNVGLMCRYLLRRFGDTEETLDQGVYRLPAAHFLVLKDGRLRKARYWDIDPARAIRYRSDQEYAEHFLSLFSEIVRAHLRGQGPVGVLLSGGLDSSSIVCTAQLLFRQGLSPANGLETFSLLYDHPACDERAYIGDVIRQWSVRANLLNSDEQLGSLDFEQVERYPDVPYFPTLLAFATTLEQARQKGIRVMLDGFGGDDLLASSFGHLTDLFWQGRFGELSRQLRLDAAGSGYSPLTLFLHHCLRPTIPQPVRTFLKPLYRRLRGIPSWLGTSCLEQLRREAVRTEARFDRLPTQSQQRTYDALTYGWNTNVALPASECFSSFFGIEDRHPFFDRRLVEFLLAVPEEQRWQGAWTKTILRRAMRGILPESIRNRQTKAEFSCILDREFKDRQANQLCELFRAPALGRLGIINDERLRQVIAAGSQAPLSADDRVDWETIVWLELWCRSAIGTAMEDKNGRTSRTALAG